MFGECYGHLVKRTGTTVFAATMHLPEQNGRNASAGAGDTGIAGSGIRLGADGAALRKFSSIRVIGIDANRRRSPPRCSAATA
ncbi:hypothetical protein [Nonomuraea fuscirosea]|uniref:hypothetical protein n=1 Tax=Nonomuraea fuscirosea TaxID=1291556 RepID=UPI00340BA404